MSYGFLRCHRQRLSVDNIVDQRQADVQSFPPNKISSINMRAC